MGRQSLFAPRTKSSPGLATWNDPMAQGYSQRGFPQPLARNQTRAAAGQPFTPQGIYPNGLSRDVVTPYFSRGAAATVQNYGKVLYNPIGAGVVVRGRIKPQNSKPGQYEAGAIFWTAQDTPTSVKLTGLQNPAALAAVLGSNYVQAAVRTTG